MNERLKDPINYKEACYYIAFEKLGSNTKEYYNNLPDSDKIRWLGTNCGQWFLKSVEKLIEEYQYKEQASIAIIMGEISDKEIYDKHNKWIENKLNGSI